MEERHEVNLEPLICSGSEFKHCLIKKRKKKKKLFHSLNMGRPPLCAYQTRNDCFNLLIPTHTDFYQVGIIIH